MAEFSTFRLCHGCRTTYSNKGQEINGIFYCQQCVAARRNSGSVTRRSSVSSYPAVITRTVANNLNNQNSNNSLQRIYSYNSRTPSLKERIINFVRENLYKIIMVSILIVTILCIIPKKTNNNTTHLDEETISKNVQPNPQPASNITNPSLETTPIEYFTVAKYVHTRGLNVRSGPGLNYSSLFILPQDSIVYLSDISRSGAWVKVKHNNKIGWVNQTFLREFRITSMDVGNNDASGNWITRPGNKLYANQFQHLGISINVNTTSNYNKETKFFIKLLMPNGGFVYTPSIKPFATFNTSIITNGSFEIKTYFDMYSGFYSKNPGTWKVQLYYQNPSNPDNTLECIATKSFTLY